MSIKKRKKDHVNLCVNDDVSYKQTGGFENYRFVHNALPECNLEDVSLEATLLGRTFSYPLMISSMTGGYTDAGSINSMIAVFCEKNNLPFGVGSQRALFDHPEEKESFAIVRKKAPSAFIAANIGGAQLIGGLEEEKLELLTSSIDADAVIVHLNPLQELMQPEGDRNFKGVEEGIQKLVLDTDLPVIVKETGAGINGSVARRLLVAGVQVIDVAGAGGTSWAKVENMREQEGEVLTEFDDWGIPTATCIKEVNELRDNFQFGLIASGGVSGSFDLVKSLCLGAVFTAAARPVIKALAKGGVDELQQMYNRWRHETKVILTLLGCKSVKRLSSSNIKEIR